MTRDDIITFGKKKYGEQWIAKLAKELGYSVAGLFRVITGEVPEVSRRLELEMKQLMHEERLRYMKLHAVDVRY
jgi:hypothetical protein